MGFAFSMIVGLVVTFASSTGVGAIVFGVAMLATTAYNYFNTAPAKQTAPVQHAHVKVDFDRFIETIESYADREHGLVFRREGRDVWVARNITFIDPPKPDTEGSQTLERQIKFDIFIGPIDLFGSQASEARYGNATVKVKMIVGPIQGAPIESLIRHTEISAPIFSEWYAGGRLVGPGATPSEEVASHHERARKTLADPAHVIQTFVHFIWQRSLHEADTRAPVVHEVYRRPNV